VMLHAIKTAPSHDGAVCLGPLNDWFFNAHLRPDTPLARCAANHPLARQLDERGLPLQEDALRGFSASIAATSPGAAECAACLYLRMPDADPTAQRLTRELSARGHRRDSGGGAASWLERFLRQSTDQFLGRSGGRGASHVVELVTNCSPWHECALALKRAFPRIFPTSRASSGVNTTVGMIPDPARAARSFAAHLAVSLELGSQIFDQLRCARCERLVPLDLNAIFRGSAAGQDVARSATAGARRDGEASSTSAFFQTATRMHRQLAHMRLSTALQGRAAL
jgi:hypothetical protein